MPSQSVVTSDASKDGEPRPATAFRSIFVPAVQQRENEHGGRGPIAFRRVLDSSDFTASVDFIDYTVIPPGSSIGRHQHVGNDEIYFVMAGAPLMRVNAQEARIDRGSLSIVHDGGFHELINDTADDVEILVMQVRA